MKHTKNTLNILTSKSYKGIGNAWIVKNLKGNEDVDAKQSGIIIFNPNIPRNE